MSYSQLELWFYRDVERRRQAALHQYPTPHDGASWVCMTNYLGVVGLVDERIGVNYVSYQVANKLLELWPKRVTWFTKPSIIQQESQELPGSPVG